LLPQPLVNLSEADAMSQHYYREEHEAFREQVKRFIAKEILPFHSQWEVDGIVPRSLWQRAGQLGLLCMTSPSAYGGQDADILFPFVLNEELAKTYVTGPSFGLHSDIIAPYLVHFGTEEQKRSWLPKMASGEVITAIAMTEPGAGSDLQAIKTRADRDGDDYLITVQKTFISNGQLADMVVVVAKTDPSQGAKGVSLFLVESDREGFRRGRNLEKIGRKAQDTSELFFDQVRIPISNRLAPEGQGFFCLMKELPRERMLIAVSAMATTEAVLDDTIAYVKSRQIFGKPIIDFSTQSLHTCRSEDRGQGCSRLHQSVHARTARGSPRGSNSGDGKTTCYGAAESGDRCMPSIAWRLWLHVGIPGCSRLGRFANF